MIIKASTKQRLEDRARVHQFGKTMLKSSCEHIFIPHPWGKVEGGRMIAYYMCLCCRDLIGLRQRE